jgi:hypothetical protein
MTCSRVRAQDQEDGAKITESAGIRGASCSNAEARDTQRLLHRQRDALYLAVIRYEKEIARRLTYVALPYDRGAFAAWTVLAWSLI